MRLSDIPEETLRGTVVHDGAFRSIGFVRDRRTDMLVPAESESYVLAALDNPGVAAVLTRPEFVHLVRDRVPAAVVADPMTSLYRVHEHLVAETHFYGAPSQTLVDARATVSPLAYVAATNVEIGPGCHIEPFASIMEGSRLGRDVVIRSGVRIGHPGFQVTPGEAGEGQHIVTHVGGVALADGVEIQANSAVDSALFGGPTTVGSHTKIDNLVHIAHSVSIGIECQIAAGVVLGGSVVLGNRVFIGPGVTVCPGATVGDDSFLTMGSVIVSDVPPGTRVTGHWAVPHAQFVEFNSQQVALARSMRSRPGDA